MTPKEEANSLIKYYYNLIQEIGGELGQEILVSILAKECALFAVKKIYDTSNIKYIEYWEEVQYEIENLMK